MHIHALTPCMHCSIYSYYNYSLTLKRDQDLCFPLQGISGNPSIDKHPPLPLLSRTPWELVQLAAAMRLFCCAVESTCRKCGTYFINSTLDDMVYRMDSLASWIFRLLFHATTTCASGFIEIDFLKTRMWLFYTTIIIAQTDKSENDNT